MTVKPINAFPVEDYGVYLEFDDDAKMSSGRYRIRGGVHWPEMDAMGRFWGYAVLVAHGTDGCFYVVEESEFTVIDHVVSDDLSAGYRETAVVYRGLAPWFNANYATWLARCYYWSQDWQTTVTHFQSIRRSMMIEPKPSFLEVALGDPVEINNLNYSLDSARRLIYAADGGLKTAFDVAAAQLVQKGRLDKRIPQMHALNCALVGLGSMKPLAVNVSNVRV